MAVDTPQPAWFRPPPDVQVQKKLGVINNINPDFSASSVPYLPQPFLKEERAMVTGTELFACYCKAVSILYRVGGEGG